MKCHIILMLFVILGFQWAFAQDVANSKKTIIYNYYNENDSIISESEFKIKEKSPDFYIIRNDSLQIIKLAPTKEQGQLKDRNLLINYLEKITGHEIDDKKSIVIIFHPGEDRCNSTSAATQTMIKQWHNKMEKGIKRIDNSEVIYVCKSFEDLRERDKVLNYYEDIDQTIENLFFKFHYPCASFVVINKNGAYSSRFGEFPKESVWKILREVNR